MKIPASLVEKYLYTYDREFFALKFHGGLIGEWANVYNHCLAVGLICNILGHMMLLSSTNRIMLTKAALLHDWYKKSEIEGAKKEGPDFFKKSGQLSHAGLLLRGYDKQVADLTCTVTPYCLKTILNNDQSWMAKALHWADDAVLHDEFVGLEARINNTEKRYPELAEKSREEYNGKTLFDVQRTVGASLQRQLEAKCGIPLTSLNDEIKKKILLIQKNQTT